MDIKIKEAELENLIKKLEEDNKNIVETVNSIYETMSKIEKNDWDSPEKSQLDEGFIPYLKKESDVLNRILNNKTTFLKQALEAYRNQNENIKTATNDLEVL